nr:threonylcarbamoyl-AMP synthase [Lachnospiraceae bacterium]
MDTKWVKIPAEKADKHVLKEAGEIIQGGGLVAFPTETVYGLGGDAMNPESAKKIYAAKGRPSDNPLIVHICKTEDMEKIVREVPKQAYVLAERFWPGPLTMIMKKADCVPKETTGGLDTVAVRLPDHPVALAFIREAGGFVAAPSANTSGRPSPTLGKYVYEDMNGRIEMILDGGEVGIGVESTIIDLTEDIPVVLRPGYVTWEMLQEVLGEVCLDPTMLEIDCQQAPKAPGMKYRHYAPRGELVIVSGDREKVSDKIGQLLTEKRELGFKTGVIVSKEEEHLYRADSVKVTGDRTDMAAVARNLFRILREFDDENIDCMYVQAFPKDGIGQAVMNRMLKAAGHRIIEV